MWRMSRLTLALALATASIGVVSPSWGQSAAELLEKGIYAEETVGDLAAAIEIYGRILESARADRPHVARALYRIGRCYLELGKRELATEALGRLARDYADQGDLVARARKLLPGLEETELALTVAPWVDGELLRFALRLNEGRAVGDLTISVTSTKRGDRMAWRLEQIFGAPDPRVMKFSRVEVEKESFRPLAAVFRHTQLGSAETEYTGGERRMVLSAPGEEPTPVTDPVGEGVYDNEQNIHLIRRLPLAEGFEATFRLAGRPGAIGTIHLEVEGKESVTVPAGTFECLRTVLHLTGETHWYTADEHRYLVKVVKPDVTLELTGIARVATDSAEYRDPEAGVSLTAPAGWDLFASSVRDPGADLLVQIFSPEMKAWGLLCRKKAGPGAGAADARAAAEREVATAGRKLRDYTVREDGWAELEVSGSPAVAFVADFVHLGWKMTEYRIHVARKSSLHWLAFQVERSRFEAVKGVLDAVVASLKLEGE